MVIDKLKENRSSTTKKTEPNTILFDFIDKYINDNEATREPGSLTVYRSMKKHLQAYELKTKKKVTFDKVDYSFFQSFQNFLIGRTKIVAGIEVPMLNNNTIAKQLSTVKTFLNYANKTEGIAVSDTCKNFKIKKDELEVIALTNEEFEALYYFDLTDNKRLAQVRDIFCFSCCTGLRYSDMNQLKWENIKENELMLTVIKTSQKLTVPLNPYSRAILARYEGQRKPLPMISNQKLNDYVKELCKSAGINERIEIVRFRGIIREAITYPKYELIGVHCGRKTYVTLSLEKGMSAEQVMSCTGHKSYSSFKRYINITRTLKIVAVNKAWGEPLSEIKLKAI
jgi:integrase